MMNEKVRAACVGGRLISAIVMMILIVPSASSAQASSVAVHSAGDDQTLAVTYTANFSPDVLTFLAFLIHLTNPSRVCLR